ncbi:hypothetical protein LMG28727_04881 [Paraburkholderia kirstenboschensis]|uniref:hypothetical protein n=1 Tax=Paraburkholderia kirstenboschensis TaxID=1245436 RepID=UPI000AF7F657|nr:hypothetical protein [Paraburkholderia kirstenboschensis]CAD6548720.1 hypothetical protein LMG28727_04881 [Paraburkholderia kirstenboschensis]
MDIATAEAHIKDSFTRNNAVIAQYASDAIARIERQSAVLTDIVSLKSDLTLDQVSVAKNAALDMLAVWDEFTRLATELANDPDGGIGLQNRQSTVAGKYQAGMTAYQKIKGWASAI